MKEHQDPAFFRKRVKEFIAKGGGNKRKVRDLDEGAQRVLDRLTAGENWPLVAPAFALIHPAGWEILIGACITAEARMRLHSTAAGTYERRRDEAENAGRALEKIRKWRIGAGFGHDVLSARAVATLETLLAAEKEWAEKGRMLLGRKTSPDAARSSAVGWLSEEVRRLTGKPHRKEVADFAAAVLSDPGVDAETVRRAVTPRERIEKAAQKPSRSNQKK